MNDPKQFAKLFNMRCPVPDLFEYYYSLLLKSPEFVDFPRYREVYEAGPSESFMKHLDPLILRLKESKAHAAMLAAPLVDLQKMPAVQDREGHFVSIDIRSANWTALKMFDKDELPATWAEFCSSMNLPRVFAESKYCRQVVFGYISPKRLQAVQSRIVGTVAHELAQNFSIASQGNDELILFLGNEDKEVSGRIKDACQAVPHVQFRVSNYRQTRIGKDMYLRQYSSIDGVPSVVERLVGVPGAVFYMYFKKYILKEPITENDRMFMQDGRLAMWMDTDV